MAPTTPALRTTVDTAVYAFAAKQGVTAFLDPVLDMTRRVFPDARRIEALLEDDPELADERHIVFEVDIGPMEVSHSVDRHWQWSRALFQLCPAAHTCLFGVHLKVSDS